MDLHDIREEYSKRTLSKRQCHADPLIQFQQWLDEAINAEVNEPTAMHLATVNENGKPSSRLVLLKEINAQGFVFFTNYLSQKGKALSAHPFAALTFFGRNWNGRCVWKAAYKNWQRSNPTNISPQALTPAVSALGRANKVRSFPAKVFYWQKLLNLPLNIR